MVGTLVKQRFSIEKYKRGCKMKKRLAFSRLLQKANVCPGLRVSEEAVGFWFPQPVSAENCVLGAGQSIWDREALPSGVLERL